QRVSVDLAVDAQQVVAPDVLDREFPVLACAVRSETVDRDLLASTRSTPAGELAVARARAVGADLDSPGVGTGYARAGMVTTYCPMPWRAIELVLCEELNW